MAGPGRPRKHPLPTENTPVETPLGETADPKAPAYIKVLEDRVRHPFGESSAPIDLKDPSLVCRWINTAIASDKVWRTKRKGWMMVRPEELADPDQVGGFTRTPEGFVARGDKGGEVLMAMPRDYLRKIQMSKAEHNLRNMGNPTRQKAEVVEAAARQFGDRAAEFLNRAGPVGTVRDSYERIERSNTIEE